MCVCSELGASAAILRAGYNLDSMMVRYQGVDWRNEDNWGCNFKYARKNPGRLSGSGGFDGNKLEQHYFDCVEGWVRGWV